MGAYVCVECDWQYDWHMGDRVEAVKRHELTHLLERYGWRSRLDDQVGRLMMAEESSPGERRPPFRRV